MLLGIVSDSHDHLANTRGAVRMLESLAVELVIHCGDIGSADIVSMFASWTTHFVLGNVDYEGKLQSAIEAAGQTLHGRFGSLQLEGKRIAFLHGDNERQLNQAISDGQWDLVCHGHTHEARCEHVGNTLVLNPGAIYRAHPLTIAVIELPSMEATSVPIC